jgi:hypothetical protein
MLDSGSSSFDSLSKLRRALQCSLAQGGSTARIGRATFAFETRAEMVEALASVERRLREAGWPGDDPRDDVAA